MKFILKDPSDKTHVKYDLVDIPEEYKAQAEEYREHLLEAASHADDHLLELVLEGKPVPEEMLRKALRAGTLSGKLTPILCGSSKNFHGVRLLLDAVVDYLPSPLERPPVTGIDPQEQGQGRDAAQARSEGTVLRPGLQDHQRDAPATWCSCASTPASCIPRTTC